MTLVGCLSGELTKLCRYIEYSRCSFFTMNKAYSHSQFPELGLCQPRKCMEDFKNIYTGIQNVLFVGYSLTIIHVIMTYMYSIMWTTSQQSVILFRNSGCFQKDMWSSIGNAQTCWLASFSFLSSSLLVKTGNHCKSSGNSGKDTRWERKMGFVG